MNITATYKEKKTNEEGRKELTFILNSYQDEIIANELLKVPYRITLTEIKTKRTIQQNALFWELIHEISIAENGEKATSESDWEIYLQVLEQAQARFEVIAIRKEAISMLKQSFRAIKVLDEFVSPNGWNMVQVKVYPGSSKLDVKEMGKLLDCVIDRASQNGIELTYYE